MSEITIPKGIIKIGETYTGNDTTVYVKGSANGCTVKNSAAMIVFSGGTARKTTVATMGGLVVSKGTVISSVVSSGGELYIDEDGGLAKSTVIKAGGSQVVEANGKATNTKLEEYGHMIIYSGATATKLDWTPGQGFLEIKPGATVTYANKLKGIYYGSSGKFIDNKEHSELGNFTSMYVMSGGKISGTVCSGGRVYICSGGYSEDMTVNQGGVADVSSGGLAFRPTVISHGNLYVQDGGVASGLFVDIDGSAKALCGGIISSAYVMYGRIDLTSNGSAADTTLSNHGSMFVSSGALLGRTVVGEYNLLSLGETTLAGGGQLIIRDNGSVQAMKEENAKITFSVGTGAGLGGGTAAYIPNISLIDGWKNMQYYVSLSKKSNATQSFLLAQGAAGFNGKITLINGAGETASLSVGGSAKLNGEDFSLSLTGGALVLNRGKAGKQLKISASVADADDGSNNWVTKTGKKLNKAIDNYGEDLLSIDPEMDSYTLQIDEKKVANGGWEYDNYVGFGDFADFRGFVLPSGVSKLSFRITATDTVNFAIYKLAGTLDENFRDEKNKLTFKVVQSVSLTKKTGDRYEAVTKPIMLEALEPEDFYQQARYYIAVQSLNADKGGSAYYRVELEDPAFFSMTDDGNNWTDMKKNGGDSEEFGELGMVFQDNVDDPLVASDDANSQTRGWVGYGDKIDYFRFWLEEAANICFDIDSTDAVKFTVYSLTGSAGKYSLKTLQTTTLKCDDGEYMGITRPLLLKSGFYYFSVESTNANKGGNAYYNVYAGEDTKFFHERDYNHWKDLKEEGAESGYLDHIEDPITQDTWYVMEDWVGFGDEIDYFEFQITTDAEISFSLSATDATKFTIWSLNGSPGKYSLKSLQATTLKKTAGGGDDPTGAPGVAPDGSPLGGDTYAATTKELKLTAGTYYFSMESTNANKGGDANYGVYVNSFNSTSRESDALAMPETDSLSIADALSFGNYDADALADASAASLAELDGKSAWQNLALA